MNRDLPRNIYFDKRHSLYIAQVGRWYWNIKIGTFATEAEALRALEMFQQEFGMFGNGPKSNHAAAFKKLFGNKKRSISLDSFREWRRTMLMVAEAELDALNGIGSII